MSRSVLLEAPRKLRVARTSAAPNRDLAEVRLRVGGICGSDLAAYRGISPMVSYPRVLGHELVVDVIEAPGRKGLAGRRAVVEPLVRCGTCRACRMGRYNCCALLGVMGVHVDGGLQERFMIDPGLLHPVPDDMPDDLAVLAEPTSIAYRAVQRSDVRAGAIAVVFGAGPIGLLIASILLRARGVRVIVADIDKARLETAGRLGATPTPVSDLVDTARTISGGDMADVVFEATGHPACTRQTTDVVAPAGRIVLIGWNKGPVEVDTVALMRKEAELMGSRNSADAFPSVLRLLADGVVDPAHFITHRYPIGQAATALELLDEGREPAVKVLIDAATTG